MTKKLSDTVNGVILAGGKSLRMGGDQDKFLLQYQGRTLLEHTVQAAQPQVNQLIITLNGDPNRLPYLEQTVCTDEFGECSGPLAGILTAMAHYQNQPEVKWLATFPADATQFPADWVARCIDHAQAQRSPLAFAQTNSSHLYTFAVLSLSLFNPLTDYFKAGNRSLRGFYARDSKAPCFFTERFTNINTWQDWQNFIGE